MTALTGVIRQPRVWLRLLILIGVPIVVTLFLTHGAWAEPTADPCHPNDAIPVLTCTPPRTTDPGKVLGIFDIVDRNGVPISAYGLNVDQGGTFDVISKIIAFLIGIGFSVIRTVIGFACWLVDWALDFGLAKDLLTPVSDIAATIKERMIDSLGLKVLFLTIVVVWAGYLILFKQRSKGWMEICTSLVIASIASVTLLHPGKVLIGNADDTGVLGVTKQISLAIADVVLDDRCAKDRQKEKAKTDTGDTQPTTCSGQENKDDPARGVSRPITDGLVDAFIQRPIWVLYTGKAITGECSAAYGQATLTRYNFNRLVLPQMMKKENDRPWYDKLGKAFSNVFSHDGLKHSLLLATGNPWAIYTVVDDAQQQAVKDFKDKATHSDAWQKYVAPADKQVIAKCDGDNKTMDEQQISASLDNLLSVWFIALAAIIVVGLVVAVSSTFLVSQVWMAVEVIRAQPALIAGILPGGGRTLMWNWVSGVVRVILAIFLSVMFLAFFLVMVIAVLDAKTGNVMTVKFLTIDFLALAFLMFRKKVTAAAKTVASNFGQKMASKTGGGGEGSTFRGATKGGTSGLDQLKEDGATLSKVGGKARDLWRGKPPAGGGAGGGGGGARGGGAGGGGARGGGKQKKGLKQRVQGAVKLGTTVAAAVGSGGTSAGLQASAKAALKARLKNAAKKRVENGRKAAMQRMQNSRAGRATLATARTGRHIAKEAPTIRSRFKNAVATEKRNLAAASTRTPRTDSRTRDAQRDSSLRMRKTKSKHHSEAQKLNGVINGRRNQHQNLRRSADHRNLRRRDGGGNSG
ncbi:hypothetical protein OG782_16245 [Streptomyces sp. NBC_00876]|uniref:hypothetical protein n=1 Tax=Streptomyces sp. NBC_00876 TaxID=2975853 RepID=UPI0038672D0A|nr:hypothetical protein OG782_16245 [Streptomyces sp. NBC_00876]